ncbi:MAG: hypothetical protein J5685_07230 [Clostridiales bacterium]|nr:hypothetical protein [Clostridiales bacterium]
MNRLQKADMITVFILLASVFGVFLYLVRSLSDNPSDVSILEVACYILLLGSGAAWIGLYIARVIRSFITKEDGMAIPVLQAVLLPFSVILSCIFINGAWSFSPEFLLLNILSVIAVAVECIALLVLYFIYYGRGKTPVVSLFLYIIAVAVVVTVNSYPEFTGNAALILFVPMTFVGYIELLIRKAFQKRRRD